MDPLETHASNVDSGLDGQAQGWRKGFTRRRVLAGAGKVGVAALAAQLVTTRVAYAAATPGDSRTLVVLFLRGGMDGLSMVVPAFDPGLYQARPNIAVPSSALIPADRGFGLHPALAPLKPFWAKGQLAAVHAVGSPDASRSHFQAQECVERGGTGMVTGWLNRLLDTLGPGTTFRAVGEGALPASLSGPASTLTLAGLDNFALQLPAAQRDRTVTALRGLYSGLDHPLAARSRTTLGALDAAASLATATPATKVTYPTGAYGDALKDVARLIRGKAGVRVATVDVGGWDMHTAIGKSDNGQMRTHLADLAAGLAAFCTDLGPSLDNVTVVAMSEFGRRVAENASGGADHGHGGAMLLLGGGLNGGKVHGTWPGLAPANLVSGDLAGANDYRDVFAEILRVRLGVGSTSTVFPGHTPRTLGVTRG